MRAFLPTYLFQICTFSLLLTFKGCPHLEKIQASCKASPAAGAFPPCCTKKSPKGSHHLALPTAWENPLRRNGNGVEEIPTSTKLPGCVASCKGFFIDLFCLIARTSRCARVNKVRSGSIDVDFGFCLLKPIAKFGWISCKTGFASKCFHTKARKPGYVLEN